MGEQGTFGTLKPFEYRSSTVYTSSCGDGDGAMNFLTIGASFPTSRIFEFPGDDL